MFNYFLRQHGQDLFDKPGKKLGYEDDKFFIDFYTMFIDFAKDGVIAPIQISNEITHGVYEEYLIYREIPACQGGDESVSCFFRPYFVIMGYEIIHSSSYCIQNPIPYRLDYTLPQEDPGFRGKELPEHKIAGNQEILSGLELYWDRDKTRSYPFVYGDTPNVCGKPGRWNHQKEYQQSLSFERTTSVKAWESTEKKDF